MCRKVQTHSVDPEVFLAVDSEPFGSGFVRIVQNVVALRITSKQILVLHTVCKHTNYELYSQTENPQREEGMKGKK